jgi:hypothetical protein
MNGPCAGSICRSKASITTHYFCADRRAGARIMMTQEEVSRA